MSIGTLTLISIFILFTLHSALHCSVIYDVRQKVIHTLLKYVSAETYQNSGNFDKAIAKIKVQ